MIDADQLGVLTDKAGLEMERQLQGIPCRYATGIEEDTLEILSNAAEVDIGHMMDWRVLWGVYLHQLATDLATYLVQTGSGEYILYENLFCTPDVLQKTSTVGFPCRVTLTKDEKRGIIFLDILAANYKLSELIGE